MIDTAMQIIVVVESLIVALLAKSAINRMSPCTALGPRLAFILLSTGAVARLYAVYVGDVPSTATLLTTGGLAILLVCDRWRYGYTPAQRRANAACQTASHPETRQDTP